MEILFFISNAKWPDSLAQGALTIYLDQFSKILDPSLPIGRPFIYWGWFSKVDIWLTPPSLSLVYVECECPHICIILQFQPLPALLIDIVQDLNQTTSRAYIIKRITFLKSFNFGLSLFTFCQNLLLSFCFSQLNMSTCIIDQWTRSQIGTKLLILAFRWHFWEYLSFQKVMS